ncbi:MAG TPA: hypothetical protein DEQ09_00920 [Bacteroidales bacterium]|nr:hypothetical protein [Bacteroidales bacterium]
MKRVLYIILLLPSLTGIYSQTGGDNVYEFLNLSPNAYISSLGGFNISSPGYDPSMAMLNPALAGPAHHGNLSLNYVNYFAGINYGSIMYSHYCDSLGSFSGGINYLNYGRFDRVDESGIINGHFSAAEYSFNLIYSRQIDSSFSAGINLKPIISQFESYTSLGIAMDIGAAWKSHEGLINAGLTIRNLGLQITSYAGEREKIPFEVMAGISVRLRHAPLRFSITARHLEKYDLTFNYDNQDGTAYSKLEEISENIMRHLIFGAEAMPTKNFFIAAGFNYQRRKELIYDAKPSIVGFSLGAGIKTSSIDIIVGRARYHLAGSSTNFSVLVKPALFKRFK